jgi:hypothetical protein
MKYNYRVIHSFSPALHEHMYYINETYTDEQGEIHSLRRQFAFPSGETLEDLKKDLKMMLEAVEKDVLEANEV